MPKVFLSYRREDSQDLVGRLRDRLTPILGAELVFRDLESIPPGRDFREALREAVSECDVLLALMGNRWLWAQDKVGRRRIDLEHDWVRIEIETALAGGKRVIPVLVGDAEMPSSDALPPALRDLSNRNAFRLSRDERFDSDMERLIATLDPAGAVRAGSASAAAGSPPRERRRTALPVFDTPFVGREADLRRVVELFLGGEGLMTVIGPGGMGKTRFACAIAEDLRPSFSGGVWFVDLAEQTTPVGVSNAVAQALGLDLAREGSATEIVARMLEPLEPTLLLLDNFEQVARFARETVGAWRQAAPQVKLLVTSQVDLGVGGTHYNLEALESKEAVRLFVDRAARRNRGRFELTPRRAEAVAEICRRLDGLPLPIVLVAERTRHSTVEELLSDIQEFGPVSLAGDRLRQTFQWSYGLLDPEAREVFRQACIFRDGFGREAVRAVLGVQGVTTPSGVFEVVQKLCDQSLLLWSEIEGESRFGMYQTILELGQELWGAPSAGGSPLPPEDVALRWAEHYLEFLERWNRSIPTPDGGAALSHLVRERENVLAAHEWALRTGRGELAARLILAYAPTLEIRGPWPLRPTLLRESLEDLGSELPELRVRLLVELSKALWAVSEWTEADECSIRAVEIAEGLRAPTLRAEALHARARQLAAPGPSKEAVDWYLRSRELARQVGDEGLAADSQAHLARQHDLLGEHAKALELLEEVEGYLERSGDLILRGRALNFKALALWHLGRSEEALGFLDQAAEVQQLFGDIRWTINNRGLILNDLGRGAEALQCFQEGWDVSRGNRSWEAVNLGGKGVALALRRGPGDLESAEPILRQALEAAREVGSTEEILCQNGNLGRVLLDLGQTAEAREYLAEAVEMARPIYDPPNRRLFGLLVQLARAESACGNAEAAARLAREAEETAERLGLVEEEEAFLVRKDLCELRDLGRGGAAPRSAGEPRLPAGLSLPPHSLEEVRRLWADRRGWKSYRYPWPDLAEDLRNAGSPNLKLLGYGSLMNPASAALTLGEAPRRPVLAFGVRRVFNYGMNEGAYARYGRPADPRARAALNAYPADSPEEVANGILLEVSLDDLPALRERERGYDLHPVVCLDWDRPDAQPFRAWFFSGPDDAPPEERRTDDSLLPHPHYLQVCREGAASVSEPFLQLFLETTVLGDRLTPLARAGIPFAP